MLRAIFADPGFADIDRHFARFIGEFGGGELPALAAALLSRAVRAGHVCLDLAEPGELASGLEWPAMPHWRDALAANRAIGGPDQECPLVLDHAGRLYLRRYWEYECALAQALCKRCAASDEPVGTADDPAQRAIATAVRRWFTVISGGPGTGKTTTALRILEHLAATPAGAGLRIALAAPTGRAAARLQEVLRASAIPGLPTAASTIHRLLGARNGSIYFHHHAANPLPVDLLVVDEASMIPLPLMAKLCDALPDDARLILLGDCDQLASVEPGAVLADIADAAAQPGSPLAGSVVVLTKNYRFRHQSAIFALANAVRSGDSTGALQVLERHNLPDLAARPVPPSQHLAHELKPRVLEGYTPFLRARTPGEALAAFRQFRVLCATRTGPFGVEAVNALIIDILRGEGLLEGPAAACRGLPVLITQNDYDARLFNGDTGILLPATGGGPLMAWFDEGTDGLRPVPPAQLPPHEPAFALTVHKSQGSEFDHVLLLLPDRDSPLLTRELIYTGITRARNRIELWHDGALLAAAVARRVRRGTGLRERLAQARLTSGPA